jgi:hypothetical protein
MIESRPDMSRCLLHGWNDGRDRRGTCVVSLLESRSLQEACLNQAVRRGERMTVAAGRDISSGIGRHRTCHAVQTVTIPEVEHHDEPMSGSITIADSASSAVACEEGEAACRMWYGMHRVARTRRCRFAASAVLLLHGLTLPSCQWSPINSSACPQTHPRDGIARRLNLP